MIRRRFVVDDVDGTIDAQSPNSGNPNLILAGRGRTLYGPKPVQRASDVPATTPATVTTPATGLTVMNTTVNPDGSMTVTLSDGTAQTIPASTAVVSPSTGFDLTSFLSQQFGPFTLQTWLLIGGAGAVAYFLFVKKR